MARLNVTNRSLFQRYILFMKRFTCDVLGTVNKLDLFVTLNPQELQNYIICYAVNCLRNIF